MDITRRDFLKVSAFFLGRAAFGGTIADRFIESVPPGVHEVERFAESFPTSVPGGKVYKYLRAGAEKYFIHVLQLHSPPRDSSSLVYSSEFEEHIKVIEKKVYAVQQDIEHILSYLAAEYGLRDVYAEGLFKGPGHQRFDEEQVRSLSERLHELTNKEERKLVHKQLEKALKMYTRLNRQELVERGAVYKLARKGIVHVHSAEGIKEFLDAGIRMGTKTRNLDNTFSSQDINLVCEKREDALLRMIATSSAPVTVAVYGATHAFGGPTSCGQAYARRTAKNRYSTKDNLALLKIGLIEIVPKAL